MNQNFFEQFIFKLSEYYNEKANKTYFKVIYSEIKDFNPYQLDELFKWLVRNVSRQYKSLPSVIDIDNAKQRNSIKLFPKNIEQKNQEYLAILSGKPIPKKQKQIESKEPVEDRREDIIKMFSRFKNKNVKST